MNTAGKKTVLIELYAGPGVGKSTTAAKLFHWFKTNSKLSVELVQEVAKEYAWAQQSIHQPDIFFEQARRVDRLMGLVDVVITDSPSLLSAHYDGVRWARLADALYYEWKAEGHEILVVGLTRTKQYDPRGRYQTEEEAKSSDAAILELAESYHGYIDEFPSSEELLTWIETEVVPWILRGFAPKVENAK